MRAMILSAGYGSRLWPLTVDRTKAAVPILGKPLAGYVAEYLAQYGWRDVVVNLHHMPESVRRALGDGQRFGVNVQYIEEPEILGTSGALDNARHLLGDETFMVINGKIITDIDLNQALETHRRSRALATLVLLPNTKRERFTVVETENGRLKSFRGMADDARAEYDNPLMFTGIQILEPRIFDYIPRGVFSHSTTDVYPQAVANGECIAAHVASGSWYELSTIQRYLDISLILLAQKKGENVALGARSHISPLAHVSQAVLWDDVRVERGASVQRVVIGDGVVVAEGETLRDCAVVRASLVQGKNRPSKALYGQIFGENFIVSLT